MSEQNDKEPGSSGRSIPIISDTWLHDYVRSRAFLVRLAFAFSLIIIARFTNSSFLGWGLFASLAILLVPITRARSFIFAFVPYATVWFVFTFLRSFADETTLAETLNLKVFQFERWLFNGQIPTITLQDRFYEPGTIALHDYFFTAVHWSYFIVPHAVAIRLWYKHPERFRQYLAALTVLLGSGLLIYFLIPTNPPWMAPEPINSPAAAPVYRVMEAVAHQIGGGIYEASYNVIGESNPIAAMPSIHTAVTVLLVFPAWYAGRRWFTAAMLYAIAMGITLVYTGEHYVVDVFMGAAVASYGWATAGFWLRALAPLLQSRVASEAQGYPPHPTAPAVE
jgi:hypothetical protein